MRLQLFLFFLQEVDASAVGKLWQLDGGRVLAPAGLLVSPVETSASSTTEIARTSSSSTGWGSTAMPLAQLARRQEISLLWKQPHVALPASLGRGLGSLPQQVVFSFYLMSKFERSFHFRTPGCTWHLIWTSWTFNQIEWLEYLVRPHYNSSIHLWLIPSSFHISHRPPLLLIRQMPFHMM